MNKKLILLVAFIVLIALLPLIGNKVVKNTIEQRFADLRQNGLETALKQENRGYLQTDLEYTVTVADEEKFLAYLQQYSSQELPPYTQSLLAGIVFGVKVHYNNIPFNEKISIDIYPVKLSKEMERELKEKNPKLYEFVKELIRKKAFVYHIDYDVVSGEFSGSMKDFNERFIQDTNATLELSYKGVRVSGKGMLLAPDTLQSSIESLHMGLKDEKTTMDFEVHSWYSKAMFESQSAYSESMKVGKTDFKLREVSAQTQMPVEVAFHAEGVSFEFAAAAEGKKMKFETDAAVKKLVLSQNAQNYAVENFHLKGVLSEVDKESFIRLQKMVQKLSTQSTQQPSQEKIEQTLVTLLSNGMHFTLADFSIGSLSIPGQNNIEGFFVKVDAKLHADPNFVKNYQDPNALVQNLEVKADMHFSKPFYALLNGLYPVDLMLAQYKKEDQKGVDFHIEILQGKIMLNGKALQ